MSKTTTHFEVPLVEMSPFGKDYRSVLVFPEPYSIASSNLAFHQIYRILGQHAAWSCERAAIEPNERVLSLETGKPLEEFDIVAFTVPFELGYLNVIKALDECPIPLYARDRTDQDPLVIMGGIAAAANPAVMAPFVDIFLLGEGEASLPPLLDLLAKRRNEGYTRLSILEEAVQIVGAYVPLIQGEQPAPIQYARVDDMDEFPPCSAWLTGETEFDNTFLFEISRGCPCGCRFCMIRLSQKPLRAVAVDRILELVDRLPRQIPSGREAETVQPKVGLVGAAVASHPDFEEICRRLREKGWGITASAIEIDKVTDGMLDLLAESQKTLTLAPERGIEAERYRLGKKISDDHLLKVAQRASELGMPRLKMYFVGGLIAPEFYGSDTDRPGAEINLPEWLEGLEDDDYYDAIFHHEAESVANLVERVAEVYQPKGKTGTIGVTCSPFIPKPHTPWSNWPMAPENGLKRLDKILKKRLGKIPRARYRTFSGWESHLQGLLSQGDQNLAPSLLEMTRHPERIRPLVREAINSGVVDLLEKRWMTSPSPWNFVKL